MQGISLYIRLVFPRCQFLALKDQIQGLGAGIREIQVDNARFDHAVKCLGIRLRRPTSLPFPPHCHKSLPNESCVFLRLSSSKWGGANDNLDNAAIFRG